MAAGDVLVAAGLVALNVGLAYVVAGVRPRRTVNLLVAALFVLNAAVLALGTTRAAGWTRGTLLLETLLDSQTFALLLIVPLVYPRARLRGRALVAAATAVSLGLAALAIVAAGSLDVGTTVLSIGDAPAVLAYDVASLATFSVGAVLLLDAYLGARSDVQRDQARYFLAAYASKAALVLAVLLRDGPAGELLSGRGAWPAVLAMAGLVVAVGAVPAAILVSRLRGAHLRSLREDAFVVGLPLLAFVVTLALPIDPRIEPLLVRPLLLTYGMLRFQLLDVDAQRHRAAFVALLILGIAELYYAAYDASAYGVVMAPGAASAVALAVTLGALAVAVPPILRRVGSGGEAEARARAIYAAALEEAVGRGPDVGSSTDRVLRALRGRLHISDREHAAMEAAARALLVGEHAGPLVGQAYLGRYRVEALLGEGGFGRTFLARDEHVDRRVVLKVARVPSEDDARRLLAEGRLLARVRHPGIVTIYDVERVGDDCVLVLEYVEGGSLAQRLAQGALPTRDALAIGDDVLRALEALHAHGIVHRDVKPGNVLLGRDSRAVLTDFGIARAPAGTGTAASYGLGGATAGTLRSMAPEQVRGLAVGPACDVYATGVLLHELLTGRSYLGLDKRADFDAARAIVEEEPSLEGVPAAIADVLRRALAKDPAARPKAAQMRELLAATPLARA